MKNFKYVISWMRIDGSENSIYDYGAGLYTENQLKQQVAAWAKSLQKDPSTGDFNFKVEIGPGRELEYESWEQFHGDIVREVEKVDSFRFIHGDFFVCIQSVEDAETKHKDFEPESTENIRKRYQD